jgi:flagellar hook protein FlgE
MLTSVYTGASALQTFTKGMEVIGNNVANVNSLGFKGMRAEYADEFYNTYLKNDFSETSGAPGNQVGSGVSMVNVSSNFKQGPIQETGIDTDLAIHGSGFFQVRNPNADEVNGTLFTRSGNFNWDAGGNLVTSEGYHVQGADGDIIIEDIQQVDSYRFENDGTLRVLLNDGTEVTQQVFLTDFRVPGKLDRIGDGYFSNKGDLASQIDAGLVPPTTEGTGELRPYSLELSNVDLTGEFANIIANQRSFQAGARVITVSDTMYSEAVNLKR